MTQEEIDTLVNEAWLQGCEFGRMAEREKEKKRQLSDIHSCGPDCDRYICVAVRKARQEERNRVWTQEHWTEYERSIADAEREACILALERNADKTLEEIIAAIRARSST